MITFALELLPANHSNCYQQTTKILLYDITIKCWNSNLSFSPIRGVVSQLASQLDTWSWNFNPIRGLGILAGMAGYFTIAAPTPVLLVLYYQ